MYEGSHREAKDVAIVRAGGVKTFRSPERGGLGMGHGAAVRATYRTMCFCSLICPDFLWDQGDRGKKQKGGSWVSSGPTHPCPSKNKFGNECCLLRQRGRPLAY